MKNVLVSQNQIERLVTNIVKETDEMDGEAEKMARHTKQWQLYTF